MRRARWRIATFNRRDGVIAPKVQATLDGMARQTLQHQLSQQLAHRPGPLDLVHNGLMQAPGVGAQVMLQRPVENPP